MTHGITSLSDLTDRPTRVSRSLKLSIWVRRTDETQSLPGGPRVVLSRSQETPGSAFTGDAFTARYVVEAVERAITPQTRQRAARTTPILFPERPL